MAIMTEHWFYDPPPQPAEGASVPEAHVVMQMMVDDFITLIHSYIQVCCGSGGGGRSLWWGGRSWS